ncbi:DUF6052 family protein [Streptomyces sp. NBC_00239]|uniref:DUF6052 family protein n=1 Tax=Streptomyces sp. NBC_00239 TaxID=2903640 RepID=UPI002E2C2478|nr:DUF6052 family protein [Streptomyces sp. NBC_00239]
MTNENSPLTADQEQRLLETYRALEDLALGCGEPAVRAAVKAALAELRTALDGQAVEFDYYREPAGVLAA